MQRVGHLPLRYPPGRRWLYKPPSDLLGVLIARVSGLALDVFLHQRVCAPLGMTDTAVVVPPDKRERVSVASGVSRATGQSVIVAHAATTIDAEAPVFLSGATGLVSTLDDSLRFGRMLLDKGRLDGVRLLSRKTVEAMTADYLTPAQHTHPVLSSGRIGGRPGGVGFGVYVALQPAGSGPSPGAFEANRGLGTMWVADPHEEMVALLMIQQNTPGLSIGEDFLTLVYQAIDD
jgi:CubicO group peptidase (beta-lactamase class C family)